MKKIISLAVLMTGVASFAFAETPAPAKPEAPAIAPKGDDVMPNGKMDIKGRAMKHNERMWEELDANKDGYISKEESEAFNKRKFDERDTDKDGKVTRAEWDAFTEMKTKEFQDKMKARMAEGMKGGMMGDAMKGGTPAAPAGDAPTAKPAEKK